MADRPHSPAAVTRASSFVHVHVTFAAASLLSCFCRNVNAVISPDLTCKLALSPDAPKLGFADSIPFYALAYAWCAWGWRRHAGVARATAA